MQLLISRVQKKMAGKWLSVALPASILLVLSIYLLVFVNNYVPVPYMDEIFHIPQAQKYCEGAFHVWDSKITTPPGLYLTSFALLKPISNVFPNWNCQNVLSLRFVNVLFTIGNVFIFYFITYQLNKGSKGFSLFRCSLTALNLATFPTLYFFTFLYYTDVGSTFAVFFSYLLAICRNHRLAAVVGTLSLFFRQTNIVWVAFFASLALKDILDKNASKELKRISRFSLRYLKVLLRVGTDIVLFRRKGNLVVWRSAIADCGLYAIVGLGFAVFVYLNKGVVLGDRSAHQVKAHFPQLFYFSAFAFFFAFPIISIRFSVGSALRFVAKHFVAFISASIVFAIVIATNTIAHPYLLADNRHYPFYIWRKFFLRHAALKFVAIPFYLISCVTLFRSLIGRRDLVWCLLYLLFLALNVVPQELLEFRYFIVPYLMYRLQLPLKSKFSLFLEFFMNLVVNILSLYLFLEKPFVWPSENVLQRFMW